MKFSEAMLKGFEQVNGRQCKYDFALPVMGKPEAFCVLGAVSAGRGALGYSFWYADTDKFVRAWGVRPNALNDQGMPWEHIYGMAVAAGL
jgi:hypothetical protein